ncbi:nitrate reductase molybdenum cofactor assembly chaperone [Corynebacterium choanae]|uniref:Nitrate reductase-like protein NarX n=1 Tax=Corynebacterium choanae TaxID=1862358 RepID=A0A3G6J650_9CORY|nr:nitrate reductase molybdenum cofactor assembly chaperone [Corynebacterium choanae]AZA13426.1 Nitrate reductase-like protein NarX [Corynebacterium choanae]
MATTHIGQVPPPTEAVAVTDDARRTTMMAAALLLDYPTESLFAALPLIAEQVATLPPAIGGRLDRAISTLAMMQLRPAEEHYVTTFDQRRRCSLFLSYYAVGDTRQRGAALLAFQESIATLGFVQQREELADHLCVLLEVAAQAEGENHRIACDMIAAHRDGLEVLRVALEQLGSFFADVVAAVCAVLPAIDPQTRDNFVHLIRQGPPAELVGIGSPLPFPTYSDA